MTNRILLKNIFINSFQKPAEEEFIETPVPESQSTFWKALEEQSGDCEAKTNLACWNCGLFFDDRSWGIPIFSSSETRILKSNFTETISVGRSVLTLPSTGNYSQYVTNTSPFSLHHHLLDGLHREEYEALKMHGNFCSVFCAIRYLKETTDFPEACKENYRNMLYLYYERQTGIRVNYIPPSLPKTLMQIYAGEKGLSETDYKAANRALEKQIL